MRTEALPRLKHAGHKLDSEWREAKRTNDTNYHLSAIDIATFEKWLAEKKPKIEALYERAHQLSTGLNLSTTGMGWTAP